MYMYLIGSALGELCVTITIIADTPVATNMVLDKKVKKQRRPPRGQVSLPRFIFLVGLKLARRGILFMRQMPGTVKSRASYWSDAMLLAAQARMLKFWNKFAKLRQKKITDYWRRQQPQ